MTTGSWNTGSLTAFTINYKNWSGGDRPRQTLPKPGYFTIFRDGRFLRFKAGRPGIHRPPKRIGDAPHAYSMETQKGQDGYVWYVNNNFIGGSYQKLNVGWSPNVALCPITYSDGTDFKASLFDANDQIALIGKLRERLTGSDFNMSVFLGEGHETLGMIAGTVIRIRNALSSLKRGRLFLAAEQLVNGTNPHDSQRLRFLQRIKKRERAWLNLPSRKTDLKSWLSSGWLELQYGWLPLLSDVEAGAQSLAHAMNVPFSTRVRVTKRRERSETRTGGGSTPRDARYYYTWHTSSRRTLVVYIKEGPSVFYQLGLSNPELVAWELLPFSFVADWFIPIGQWMEARATVSAINGTYVQSDLTTGHWGGVTGALENGNTALKYAKFVRTVSTSPALPLPAFKSLKKVASWQHCANAIALLVQMHGSK